MLDRTNPVIMATIGHNGPPEPIAETAVDRARISSFALSDWMRGRPVILDQSMAIAAKALKDRADGSLRSMQEERDARVRPLNEEVRAINASYRGPKADLESVRNTLLDRLTAYARRLEAERQAKLAAERRVAEEAAQAAMEAEQRRIEALDDASQGVCDIDIEAISQDLENTISALALAVRNVQRAERETKVRIGGGYGRVSTLRNKPGLAITDWQAAIAELGTLPDGSFALPDGIADAILTCARAYKKATGDLPAGILATSERSL